VWSARLGGEAAVAPSAEAQGRGWIVTMTMTGAATGKMTVWVDGTAAAAFARKVLELDRDPQDAEMAALLCDVVTDAAGSLGSTSDYGGIFWTNAAAVQGVAPSGLKVSYLAIANTASCVIGVRVDPAPAVAPPPAAADGRLDAVLDVELPLVVRFGRAVMPLRALADLGPGSVVDMGRSPDEPVELVVGERVIARGEVVVVAGNYGVRITELSGARAGAAGMEA
jgi:flagellar motor switch protein FliN/FliY